MWISTGLVSAWCHITMQISTLTAFHTQTHRPKCDPIMPSLPQLSPCCSPTMDWWTSSRPTSPPPPPPLLHQLVLLLPCSAIAIYSCLPLSPCNTFTPHRYQIALTFAFITKTKQYLSWRTGIHLFSLVFLILCFKTIHSGPHIPHTCFSGASTVNNSYLKCDVWS